MRYTVIRVVIRGMVIGLALSVLAPHPAWAHRPGDPPHQLYQMDDLTLESGQVIKHFAISHVTHGTLNARKSNTILMVTALSGNHQRCTATSSTNRWTCCRG